MNSPGLESYVADPSPMVHVGAAQDGSVNDLGTLNTSASIVTIVQRPATTTPPIVKHDPKSVVTYQMSIPGADTSSASVVATPPMSTSAPPALVYNTTPVLGFMTAEHSSEPEAVDEQILEALRSPKDRMFMLKLGDAMESLIADRKIRTRAELPAHSSSYHRLLVHRSAAFYKLIPETEPQTKVITVAVGTESRTPSRRLVDLVPQEPVFARPAFQIMRRQADGEKYRSYGRSSTAGEDTPLDYSDVEPSETGSTGTNKKRLTISEREAAYNEARSRIFMDFQGKDSSSLIKDRSLPHSASASTSNLSADSSSAASVGGGSSSVGDADDNVSTAPTESDKSYPPPPPSNKHHSHREKSYSVNSRKGSGNSNYSTQSSSRQYTRTSGNTYGRNLSEEPEDNLPGPGVDPATGLFLPSLYNPTHAHSPAPSQDVNAIDPQSEGHPYGAMYPLYHYPPPYLAPYGYYPYPYPPPPSNSNNEPSSSPPGEASSAPPGPPPAEGYSHVAYVPVMWTPHPPPPGPTQPQGQYVDGQDYSGHQMASHLPSHDYQHYPGYMYSPYSFPNGYSGPPSQPPFQQQPLTQSPMPLTEHLPEPSQQQDIRTSPVRRNVPRNPWNDVGGYHNQSMGPRSAKRSGSSRGTRTPGDDASVASSSSSSSRRTPASTSSTPSHPLPPRPDWAVGLTPQMTQRNSTRQALNHVDHRERRHQQQHSAVIPPSDPGDFPPLSQATPEKRPPSSGVWNNYGMNGATSNDKNHVQASTVPLGSGQHPPHPPAPMNGGAMLYGPPSAYNNYSFQQPPPPMQSNGTSSRFNDHEPNFERPSPRRPTELYNPKAHPQNNNGASPPGQTPTRRQNSSFKGEQEQQKEMEMERKRAVRSAILVDEMGSLALEDWGTRSVEGIGQRAPFS